MQKTEFETNQCSVHGGDIYSHVARTGTAPLDFSANVNAAGMPDAVAQALCDSVSLYAAYPDSNCRELTQAVSQKEGVCSEWLFFSNGAADVIFRIAYGLTPTRALVCAPTFSEYEEALLRAGCTVGYHYLVPDNNFDLTEDILGDIAGNNIVFLCSPNNPTGRVIAPELVRRIAQECCTCEATLVVDECFLDFVPDACTLSAKSLLEEFDNLIILKAFTKMYALAGVRLGYALCSSQRTLAALRRAGQPWSVSTPAQVAGVSACAQVDFVAQTVVGTKWERTWFSAKIAPYVDKVFESSANYFLVKAHPDFADRLEKKHILVRRCANYHGLDDTYFRLAVKSRKDNEYLIGVLADG